MENTKYGRRREGRWTPIWAKAQDTKANPNSWETHLVRKRWDIRLLRALSLWIMIMMMMMYVNACLLAYGLTETFGPFCTVPNIDKKIGRKPGSVGVPLINVRMKVFLEIFGCSRINTARINNHNIFGYWKSRCQTVLCLAHFYSGFYKGSLGWNPSPPKHFMASYIYSKILPVPQSRTIIANIALLVALSEITSLVISNKALTRLIIIIVFSS